MNSGCPTCGVAVIPGYVKCPRCHAALPGAGRLRRGGVDPGGTSIEERSLPVVPVAAGAVAIGVILVLALSGGDGKPQPPAAPEIGGAAEPMSAAAPPAAPPLDIPSAAGPNPGARAAELERALGRQRLWSSVEASGDRVDVRSGSCAEPAMGPTIDAARTALRGAGLTRLRCLAQSGAVVFERDL
jgi:hypothetical protein